MRQYIYKPSEAGLSEWPSGQLRLEGIDVTKNPEEADLFVIPGALTQMFPRRSNLEQLPYFKSYEEKHVAFDCSDHEPLYHTSAMFIRCNTREWYLKTDPNTISWPWPVEDMSECVALPDDGFKWDVSFQGWNWSDVRKASIQSCLAIGGLLCDFATYSDFFGYLKDYDPEFHRRRGEFRRSLRESRIALCPESIQGVFPYRFFEAMSAGRVPLLVGSGYVLPFAEEIPYGEFCIFLPAELANTAGRVAASIIENKPDFVAMGLKARYYYERYLHRDKWAALMTQAVKKKLGVLV